MISGIMKEVYALLDDEDEPVRQDISSVIVNINGDNANNNQNPPLDLERGNTRARQAAKCCVE